MPRRKLWLSKADVEWRNWVRAQFNAAFDGWCRAEPGSERDQFVGRMLFLSARSGDKNHESMLQDVFTSNSRRGIEIDGAAIRVGHDQMIEEWNAEVAHRERK